MHNSFSFIRTNGGGGTYGVWDNFLYTNPCTNCWRTNHEKNAGDDYLVIPGGGNIGL